VLSSHIMLRSTKLMLIFRGEQTFNQGTTNGTGHGHVNMQFSSTHFKHIKIEMTRQPFQLSTFLFPSP
jgi:hypothetical protein